MSRHARGALTALAARLARPDPHPALAQLTDLVLTCTLPALSDARTAPALTRAASAALACCASAPSVASLLARSLMPAFAALLERDSPTYVRDAALHLLAELHAHARAEPIAELVPRTFVDTLASPEPRHHLASLRGLARTIESLKPELAPLLADTLAHRLRRADTEPHPREALRCLRALGVAYPRCVTERVLTELRGESRCRALGALAGLELFGGSCVPELLESLRTTDAEVAARALLDGVVDSEMCSCEQLERLERRYGISDAALAWFESVRASASGPSFALARSLVTDSAARLPIDLQQELMRRHVERLLRQCREDESCLHELEALFCAVRQEALCSCDAAIAMALRLALHASSADVRESGCELTAAILNKSDEDRPALLSATLAASNEVPSTDSLRLVAHVTRALMLRGDPEFTNYLKRVLDCVWDERREAASSALELVASPPVRLSTSRHARVTPLHRQRLLQAFVALAPPAAPHLARAAVAVLAAAPPALLARSLSQMAGLVRAALEQNDTGALERALGVLHAAFGSATPPDLTPPDLAPAAVLPRLLQLSVHASMKVRLASLACVLRAADACPTRELVPLRSDVVTRLAAPLDDPKRLVRVAAVRARSRWIMVGAPGE